MLELTKNHTRTNYSEKNDLKVRYNPNDVNEIEFSFNNIYPASALISNQSPQMPKPHLVIPVTPLPDANNKQIDIISDRWNKYLFYYQYFLRYLIS